MYFLWQLRYTHIHHPAGRKGVGEVNYFLDPKQTVPSLPPFLVLVDIIVTVTVTALTVSVPVSASGGSAAAAAATAPTDY